MKTRIQTKTISLSGAGAAVHQAFNVTLDRNYPYCIGMAILDEGLSSIANSDNVQVGIDDDGHTIFDFVPIEVWQQTTNVSKRKMFRHCNLRAGGNEIRVKVKADTLHADDTLTFDVVFLLAESYSEAYDRNFQYEEFTVSSRDLGNIYETEFEVRSDYRAITGIGIVCPNPEDFMVRIDDGANIYVNDVRANLLAIDKDVSYYDRFYRCRIVAPGQTLNFRAKNMAALASGADVMKLVLVTEN